MKNHTHPQSSKGFSTIELVIAIAIAGVFIIAFYQLFSAINLSISQARQKAIASEIAYSYLRRYTGATSSPGAWFTCSTAAGSSNTNDLTINSNATGQILTSGTLSSVEGIAQTVTYSVSALAIYGCSGANAGTPLRIESTVTYGPHSRTVKHATLQGY